MNSYIITISNSENNLLYGYECHAYFIIDNNSMWCYSTNNPWKSYIGRKYYYKARKHIMELEI